MAVGGIADANRLERQAKQPGNRSSARRSAQWCPTNPAAEEEASVSTPMEEQFGAEDPLEKNGARVDAKRSIMGPLDRSNAGARAARWGLRTPLFRNKASEEVEY